MLFRGLWASWLALALVGCLEPEPQGPARLRMKGTGNCGDDPSLADYGVVAHAVYSQPDRSGPHRGWSHARVELRNGSSAAHKLHATGAVIVEVGPKDRCGWVGWPLDRTLAPNEAVAFDVEMQVDEAPPGQVFTVSLPVRVDDQATCTDVASFVAVAPR